MPKYQELLRALDNGSINAIESLDDVNFFIGGNFAYTDSNDEDNKVDRSGNFCYYNSSTNKFYPICQLGMFVNSIYIDNVNGNIYNIYIGGKFNNVDFLGNIDYSLVNFNPVNNPINNIIKLTINLNNNTPTIINVDTMNGGINEHYNIEVELSTSINKINQIKKIKKYNNRLFILSNKSLYEYKSNIFFNLTQNVKYADDNKTDVAYIDDFDYYNRNLTNKLFIVGTLNTINNDIGYIGLCSYDLDSNTFDSNNYNPGYREYLLNVSNIQVDNTRNKIYLLKVNIQNYDNSHPLYKNLFVYNLITNQYENLMDNDIYDNVEDKNENKKNIYYLNNLILKNNKLYISGNFNKYGNEMNTIIDCNNICIINLDDKSFNNCNKGIYYDYFLSLSGGEGGINDDLIKNIPMYIDSSNNIYIGGYFDTVENKKIANNVQIQDLPNRIINNKYYASFCKFNTSNNNYTRLKGVYSDSTFNNNLLIDNNTLLFCGDFIYGLDKKNNIYRSDGVIKYKLDTQKIEPFGWCFNKNIYSIKKENDNLYIIGSFNHIYKLSDFTEELFNGNSFLNFAIFNITQNKFTENFNNTDEYIVTDIKPYKNKVYISLPFKIYLWNNTNLITLKSTSDIIVESLDFYENDMYFFEEHTFMKYNLSTKESSEVEPINGKFEIKDIVNLKKYGNDKLIVYGNFSKIGNNNCNSMAIYNILENRWEKFFVFDKINYLTRIRNVAFLNNYLIFGGEFSIEYRGIKLENIGLIDLKTNNVYNFDGGFNGPIYNLSVRDGYIDIFGYFGETPLYSLINKSPISTSSGYVTFDYSYIEPMPCILKGTLIKTTLGYIPVENLNKNHIIITDTLFLAKIDKIFKTEKYKSSYDELPVLYPKNCFGNNIPNKDTYLSQKHAVFYKKENKWIIPKYNPDYYFNEFGIKVDKYEKDSILTYYHIKLKDYKDNLVVSGGLVIESLNLGKTTWKKDGNYYIRDYKIKHKII